MKPSADVRTSTLQLKTAIRPPVVQNVDAATVLKNIQDI